MITLLVSCSLGREGKGKIVTLSWVPGKEFEYIYISIKFEISPEIAIMAKF